MGRPSSGTSVAVAILGVVIHGFLAVVLLMVLVSAAYGYADSIPGGGEVSSRDELSKLGDSPMLGAAALVLLGLADVVVTTGLLIIPQSRPRAWWSPVVFVTLSVVALVIAILAFQPPPPDLGG